MSTTHYRPSSTYFHAGPAVESNPRSAKANAASIVSEAHHLSQILYAIPCARVKAIFPIELSAKGFELAETNFAGRSRCWLSVTSYLDQPRNLLGRARTEAVEQTFYRLHLTRAEQHFQWLLATSVGSLATVSARYLWALPWHLSAMEFQLAYDAARQSYQTYRLQTQSESVNAVWEIADVGEPVSHFGKQLPPSLLLQPAIHDCFVRRAGGIGLRQTRFQLLNTTHGQLRQARCDLLEQLGLLTQAELLKPAVVLLCRVARFELAAPTVLQANEPATLRMLKAA